MEEEISSSSESFYKKETEVSTNANTTEPSDFEGFDDTLYRRSPLPRLRSAPALVKPIVSDTLTTRRIRMTFRFPIHIGVALMIGLLSTIWLIYHGLIIRPWRYATFHLITEKFVVPLPFTSELEFTYFFNFTQKTQRLRLDGSLWIAEGGTIYDEAWLHQCRIVFMVSKFNVLSSWREHYVTRQRNCCLVQLTQNGNQWNAVEAFTDYVLRIRNASLPWIFYMDALTIFTTRNPNILESLLERINRGILDDTLEDFVVSPSSSRIDLINDQLSMFVTLEKSECNSTHPFSSSALVYMPTFIARQFFSTILYLEKFTQRPEAFNEVVLKFSNTDLQIIHALCTLLDRPKHWKKQVFGDQLLNLKLLSNSTDGLPLSPSIIHDTENARRVSVGLPKIRDFFFASALSKWLAPNACPRLPNRSGVKQMNWDRGDLLASLYACGADSFRNSQFREKIVGDIVSVKHLNSSKDVTNFPVSMYPPHNISDEVSWWMNWLLDGTPTMQR